MTEHRGTVLLLALDAIDPRLPEDKRGEATEAALEIDGDLAVAFWLSITHSVLRSVGHATSPGGIDAVMRQLAALSMGLLEMEPDG